MAGRRGAGTLPTLDAHCDSIVLRGVRGDPMDFADADPAYHVDLPRMRRGGLHAAPVMVGDSDLAQSSRLIDAIYRMGEAHPRHFALCRTAADVRRAWRAGRIGLAMSIESQALFRQRLAHLYNWHRLGVRVASLTHATWAARRSQRALKAQRARVTRGTVKPASGRPARIGTRSWQVASTRSEGSAATRCP